MCVCVCVCVLCALVGLVKENELIEMHGISNLKTKITGCYMSVTSATLLHPYIIPPPLTHTHAHARTRARILRTHIIEHMFKEHTFHKPKKCIEV